MVWIPGGEFSMGAADPRSVEHGGHESMADARPIHRVYVDPFWMDATEVTNQEFARFVRATGYVTVAEKKPTREEFPDAPEENLKAGSVVFTPPTEAVPLDNHYRWWNYVPGASWRHPDGPGDVVTVGKSVKGIRPGQRVPSLYFRNWTDATPSPEIFLGAHGFNIDGVLGDYIVLDDTAVAPVPESLSYEEAATLPTAGLTARRSRTSGWGRHAQTGSTAGAWCCTPCASPAS